MPFAHAADYTLTVSPTTASPGQTLTVSWTAPAGHTSTDWIGLYVPGAANTSYRDYRYLTSATSGTVSFTAPMSPGPYELRILLTGGYTEAASAPRASVTVSSP